MTITCIVVDDEPIARGILQNYIDQIPYLRLLACCSDGIEAIEFLRSQSVDLVILDIKMPRLNGLEMLRTFQSTPDVIITSAYPEYALEGFELSVNDYLLKPFSFQRFFQATEKSMKKRSQLISEREAREEDEFAFIKSDKKLIKIVFSEISFIESFGNYIYVHKNESKFEIREPLCDFEKRLPAKEFVRVHKSFIISLKAVKYMEGNQSFICDKVIPVGRVYRENLLERLL